MRASLNRNNQLRKAAANVVAVVVALMLVFMQAPIGSAASALAADDSAAPAQAPAADTTVDVALSFDHAYITYKGQVVAAPSTKVTVPVGADFEFTAEPDSGYAVSAVEVTVEGTTGQLSPSGDGSYKVSASNLSAGASVVVHAAPAPTDEETAAALAAQEAYDAAVAEDTAAEPEATAGDDAAASAEAGAKTEYVYEDADVKVTAALSDPSAVPASATFIVKRVTADAQGYNYDAYLQALNDSAEGVEYTDDNTILYDVAFMVPKTDAAGNIVAGELVEFQPEAGTVTITFQFKESQLADELGADAATQLQVRHLPLSDEARGAVDSTEDATDITADDVNVEGVSGATANVAGETVGFTVSGLSLVAFSNAAEGASLAAAEPAAALGVQAAEVQEVNGAVAITDANATVTFGIYRSAADRSSNSNPLASDDEIGVADMLYGKLHYDFMVGEGPTSGRLNYAYVLPDGLNVHDKAVTTLYDESYNNAGTWEIKDGVVYFYYDEGWALKHPNGGGNFSFDFQLVEESTETGSEVSFHFPGATDTFTVKVKPADILGQKTRSEVQADGTVQYTVTLHAQGDFEHFTFTDYLEKALSYVDGSFAFDGVPFTPTYSSDDSHTIATAPISSIAQGDHVITYSSKIDPEAYLATPHWNAVNGTRNSAHWSFYNDPDDPVEHSSDTWLWVNQNVIQKWAGNTWQNGDKTMVKWTVQVNGSDQYKVDLAGYTVTDTLKPGHTYWDHFELRDANDNFIKNVPIQEGSTSFSYTFDSDAGANKYFLVYYTVVDDPAQAATLGNSATITPPSGKNPNTTDAEKGYDPNPGGGSGTGTGEGTGGEGDQVPQPDVTKEALNADQAEQTGIVSWHSTVSGDTWPTQESGLQVQYYDSLEKWQNSHPTNENDVVYQTIWFYGEPRLSVNGVTLEEGVDYEFHGESGGTYSYVGHATNFDGETVPTAMRIRFILTSERMQAVVNEGAAVDIYYETMCDGTFMTYYNTGAVRVTEGNTEKYKQEVERDYMISGDSDVKKTGRVYYNDDAGEWRAFWEIVANRTDNWGCYTALDSPVFTVVDTLPEGMTVVEDTVDLWIVRPESSGLKYVSANLNPRVQQVGNVVTFTFDVTDIALQDWQQPMQDPDTGKVYAWVQLKFETALDPAHVDHSGDKVKLHNTATVSAGDKNLGWGRTEVTYSDSVISKTGKQEDGAPVIHYTIKVNEKGQKLDPESTHTVISLNDTLDYRTTVVLSSIAVTNTRTGEDITDSCLVSLDNDAKDANGNTTSAFNIRVPDGTPLQIDYNVSLSGTVNSSYEISNTASLDGITNKGTESKGWYQVRQADANVYGSATVLSIIKTDSDNVLGKQLSGAEFTLYKVDMDALSEGFTDEQLAGASTEMFKGTTDSNGFVALGELDGSSLALATDTLYYFKETAAPLGYAIDDASPHFVMVQGNSYDSQLRKANALGIAPSINVSYNVTDTATGSAFIQARKVYQGGTLERGQFTFQLKDADGKTLQTRTNSADGVVRFDDMDYSAAGTYEYTIAEVPGNDADVTTWDAHVAKVTVNVKAEGGAYVPEVVYSDEAPAVFTNTRLVAGSVTLEAQKTFNGQMAAGQFSFALKDTDGNVLQTATNGEDGGVVFDAIEYDEAGTYTYTISEVIPKGSQDAGDYKWTKDGMTYDGHVVGVTVDVVNEGGQLVATPAYEGGSAVFANAYEATGSVAIEASKSLTGKSLADNSFDFELVDSEGNVVRRASSDAEGNVHFPAVDYTAAGTYEYVIREVVPAGAVAGDGSAVKDGMTYDTHAARVTVTVTDDGRGTLTAVPAYSNEAPARFANSYDAAGSVVLTGQKTLTGRDFRDGDSITFTLAASEETPGAPLPEDNSVTITPANGRTAGFSFGAIRYGLADSGKQYKYVVTESSEMDGIRYDAGTHTVVVSVQDDGTGTLTVTPAYSDGDQVSFTNAYEAKGQAVISGTKVLQGASLSDHSFTFELLDETGAAIDSATSDSTGAFTFRSIEYTQEDIGKTFTYQVREVPDGRSFVTFDDSVKTVRVTVGDSGTGELQVAVQGDDLVFTNTYEYRATGTFELRGGKTVEGRAFLPGDSITFTVTAPQGTPLPALTETTINPTEGNVAWFSFGDIAFSEADAGKTYTYTVTETATMAGTQDDGKAHTVMVGVTDEDNDGNLEVRATYSDGQALAFVNTYGAAGSATLGATKALSGRALEGGQFSFVLKDATGAVVSRATNDASGNITFDALEYALADVGEHAYTISEEHAGAAGYTYDSHVENVTVTVSDPGTGALDVAVAYDGDGARFENAYSAAGEARIVAHKALTGRELAANQFSFQLLDSEGNLLQTVANDAAGDVAFDALTFDEGDAGKEFSYIIREVNSGAAGYTYDAHEETATVRVSDNGDGSLAAEVSYDSDGATFANEYAATGSVGLTAQKTLQGRALEDGQFEFELRDSEGNLLQTVANDAAGAVAFEPLTYSAAGTYTYTIAEIDGAAAGYTYDGTAVTATVTVTDDGAGRLSADVVYTDGGNGLFVNSYDASGSLAVTGSKAISGREFRDGDSFSFIIAASPDTPDAPLPADREVTIAPVAGSSQPFSFGEIAYALADAGKTYKYVVTERADVAGVVNDAGEHTVTVTVADTGDGTLEVDAEYSDGDELVFANEYVAAGQAALGGTKTLSGAELRAGAFSFQLLDENGAVLQTVSNVASGDFGFEPIAYTLADAGKTFTYRVREVGGAAGGITYDTTVKTVTVGVSDNGDGTLGIEYGADGATVSFANEYTASGDFTLTATKALTGRDFAEGDEFTFTVSGSAGAPLPAQTTVTVAPTSGRVALVDFGTIGYALADAGRTYTYTIAESVPAGATLGEDGVYRLNGVSYDAHSETVTVTVRDNGDGTLTAEPAYDADGAVFTNSYQAKTSIRLSAQKTVNGEAPAAGTPSFGFTLTGPNVEGALSASTDAAGVAAFGEVEFTEPGTYTYLIREDVPANAQPDGMGNLVLGGYTYDQRAREVTVTVTEGDGQLVAVSDAADDTVAFDNGYEANGSAAIAVSKTLNGKAPAARQFTFLMTGGNLDEPLYATNDANGLVSFEELHYTLADAGKTFTYTVSERVPSPVPSGYTYDPHQARFAVTVADLGNGELSATTELVEGSAEFVNTYRAEGEAQVKGVKVLQGRDLAAGQFRFQLKDAEGNLLQTVANSANGTFEFAPVSYDLDMLDKTDAEGVRYADFTYTVNEVVPVPVPAGYTYDETVKTIRVHVADAGDGTLSVAYGEAGNVVAFTNTYDATGVAKLTGTKTIENRAFLPGDTATFVLTGSEGAPMPDKGAVTISPTAGYVEEFAFGEITYTLADVGKTYRYTVTEQAEMPGTTPDALTHAVTVTVTDAGNGTLNVATDYTDGAGFAFVNTYGAADTSFALGGTKALVGRDFVEGDEFTFVLSAQGQAPLPEVTEVTARPTAGNAAQFGFGAIAYTLADAGSTYVYTIAEQAPAGAVRNADGSYTAAGITYDSHEETVRVTVTDNGDGTISATAAYDDADGVLFTNEYEATGQAQVKVAKTLNGRTLHAGEFSFALSGDDVQLLATNSGDGFAQFDEMTYTLADLGEHVYTISEQPGDARGVSYTQDVRTVRVNVTDNHDGTLDVEYLGYDPDEGVSLSNDYSTEGELVLSAHKTLSGAQLQAGQFTFALSGDGITGSYTATNDADGNVVFPAIRYTQAGTYIYTMSEQAPAGATSQGSDRAYNGYTYDGHVARIVVTATDNGDGTMSIDVSSDENATEFSNSYQAEGTFDLSATKQIVGRPFQQGDAFTFTVVGSAGAPMPASDTVTIRPTGGTQAAVDFGTIEFDLDDAGNTYVYTVTEAALPQVPGVTNDQFGHTVTVHVADRGNGTLEIVPTYSDGDEMVLTNRYEASGEAVLFAQKTLVGGELQAGQFYFTLTGDTVQGRQRVAADADGRAEFPAISFTLEDAGKDFHYTIGEVDGGIDGIVYDTHQEDVTIHVEDAGDGTLAITYDGQDEYAGAQFVNTQLVRTGFSFTKYYFGGEGTFDFLLTAVDASGAPRAGQATDYSNAELIVDDGTGAFTATVHNGAFEGGMAQVVFPEISFASDGDYYYLVQENEATTSTMIADDAQYLVHVTVTGGQVADTTYELVYDGTNYGPTSDLSFYNNSAVTLGFASLSAQAYTGYGEKTSVYPQVKKYLNGSTERLVGGDFEFELVEEASGAVVAAATNDEAGNVAFFDEDDEQGLVFTEPGEYRYIIREVAGDEPGITYDESEITLTVTVTETAEGLVAEQSFGGAVSRSEEPAFYNTMEGIDLTVQKVSRYGGEGLVDCTYALWMVGDNGDVLIAEATSDEYGYIVFRDVNLQKGMKYYFKEVEAPSGHTVDPYRTAYFALNAEGTAVELVEETAADGWHSATENIEVDRANGTIYGGASDGGDPGGEAGASGDETPVIGLASEEN